MPLKPTRIFIGSSSSDDGKRVLNQLTRALEEKKIAPTLRPKFLLSPWTDDFRPGRSIEQAFSRLLDSNDFFVLILTPDAQSTRLSTGKVTKVCNENVLFEAGAAYGRYGLDRLLLVIDSSVELISELQGIITLSLDSANTQTFKANVGRIADEIELHISRVISSADDRRIRWLSFMKCKPALQRDVVRWIVKIEQEAYERWNVKYEKYGVLWGPPDDFLLFSAPGVDQFIGFITHLRNRFGDVLQQVDSRLVFPKKYWQQDTPASSEMVSQQLVLLKCAPQYVENAYEALLTAAQNEAARGITEVDIVTVGIATGDSDLFFITASVDEKLHRVFVEKHLHRDILQEGWLVENTTSMAIT
jgi:hypothetical protein